MYMCVSLCSCVKSTTQKTSTTDNNKMRQEDINIKYRRKGENTEPKNPIPTKSSSQSPMRSQNALLNEFVIVTRKLLCGMIAVRWDYILAAKIFHPKRNSQ